MSLHIKRFVDRVQVAETKGSRDIVLTIQEARALHADITKLLLDLETLAAEKNNKTPEIVKIEVTGGDF